MIDFYKKRFNKDFTFAKMAPIFVILLQIPLCRQVNSQDFSSEHTILLSFKQHWGNPPSLTLWNSSSFVCDWPGIECTSGAVTGLFLPGQRLSGTIPSTICQLKDQLWNNLSRNNMSGYIPVSLSICSNLERLDLSMNALSGTIPGELFVIKSLRLLSLNGNRLFGEILTQTEAPCLEFFDLSDNHLNGSIPDDITNLYNLMHLDLSMNFFSGSIPTVLFHMRRLYHMSLGYNNLTGQLPAEMEFFNLAFLNLTHNHLHGTVPKYLGQVASLSTLDLSNNQLSGNIVENLFYLGLKSSLRICSNKFVGKIPYEFVNQQFDENCIDRSNLCSDKIMGQPSCPSSLCSDYRFQGFLQCDQKNEKSRRYFVIIMVGTAGCGVVGVAILYYLARKCIIARFKNIWLSSPSTKDEEEWEMIAFQKLKVNKTDILAGLTDENLIGRVFMSRTGNTFAVKSILNSRKSDDRLQKEFLAEIRTLGTIRHNNIVKLFCCISGKELKLLVYQYFENKSLDQWLHGNKREISLIGNSSVTKLDWPMRLHIAIEAAQGLCYMHHYCSPLIVHRDVKSNNILLDSEFNAKIADFGLAKLLTRDGDTETASAVAGTFGYIAPEYAYTTKVNTKSDVYSFGVVLLELTTGREAVTHGDHMNLAERAKLYYRDIISIVDALDDDIKDSTYLDQIITVFRLGVVCTARSPSDRPSMKDCLRILQNCRKSSCSSSPNVQ